MKIVVFVKQIPDTNDVRMDPKTGNLRRDGVKSRINPVDINVIEAAVQMKHKHGATVVAVSMGPTQAKRVLMKALALGCDEAYLLSDRAFGGSDTLATAYTLAKAVEKIGDVDLVLAGRNSDDGDTAQIGPAVAAFLGIPQITLATAMDLDDGWVYCQRTLENSVERVRAKLPALVAVCPEMNTPNYATPANILSAWEKPFTVLDAAALGADPQQIGIAGSPSSTKNVFEPKTEKSTVSYFTGSPKEIAKMLVDTIKNEHMA